MIKDNIYEWSGSKHSSTTPRTMNNLNETFLESIHTEYWLYTTICCQSTITPRFVTFFLESRYFTSNSNQWSSVTERNTLRRIAVLYYLTESAQEHHSLLGYKVVPNQLISALSAFTEDLWVEPKLLKAPVATWEVIELFETWEIQLTRHASVVRNKSFSVDILGLFFSFIAWITFQFCWVWEQTKCCQRRKRIERDCHLQLFCVASFEWVSSIGLIGTQQDSFGQNRELTPVWNQ